MRDRQGRATWAVLAGLAVAGLPYGTLPVLTLSHAARLALPLSAIQAFYAAYWIGTVVAVLPMAALAARVGPRRAFLGALAMLAALGPATTLSLELVPLLSLHVLQGAGSALLLCAGLSLLRTLYGEDRLGLGLGLTELAGVVALVLLQGSAGLMFAWAGTVGVAVPTVLLTLLALLLGWPNLPRPEGERSRFDGFGAALAVLCLGLLLAALHCAPFRPLLALLLLNLGALAAAGWVWQQWRRPAPLLPLDLLARPGIAASFGAALLGSLALAAAEMGFAARLNDPWSLPQAGQAGLFLMLSGSAVGAAVIGGGSGFLGLARIGASLLALGLGGLAVLAPDDGSMLALGGLILLVAAYGIGSGLFRVGNRLSVLRAAPVERSAAAAGLLVLAGGLGTLLGPTLIVLLPSLLISAEFAASAPLWLTVGGAAAAAAALLSRPWSAGQGAERRGRSATAAAERR